MSPGEQFLNFPRETRVQWLGLLPREVLELLLSQSETLRSLAISAGDREGIAVGNDLIADLKAALAGAAP